MNREYHKWWSEQLQKFYYVIALTMKSTLSNEIKQAFLA